MHLGKKNHVIHRDHPDQWSRWSVLNRQIIMFTWLQSHCQDLNPKTKSKAKTLNLKTKTFGVDTFDLGAKTLDLKTFGVDTFNLGAKDKTFSKSRSGL